MSGSVKIIIEGSASEVGAILSGNLIAVTEEKLAAEKERDVAQIERGEMQTKFWDAQDELNNVRARERTALAENERLTRLVRARDEEIQELNGQVTFLRSEVAALRNKVDVDLTEEQLTKLAEERERVFQELLSGVNFPEGKPKPTSLRELMTFFVYPIFQSGSESNGTEWRTACANKIAMIKEIRHLTGAGLKGSKDFLEGVDGRLQ